MTIITETTEEEREIAEGICRLTEAWNAMNPMDRKCFSAWVRWRVKRPAWLGRLDDLLFFVLFPHLKGW